MVTQVLASGPKDEADRQRFQGRLQDIAHKRGVAVWADVIDLEEGRL